MSQSAEPVSPSSSDNGRVKRVFKTYDHPEAAGRSPQKGEAEYPLTFGLDDGSQLIVRMGESGFQNVTNLLMMMLANVPSSDDGSLTGISYTELKAENARLFAALAEKGKELIEAYAQVTATRARETKALDDSANQYNNLTQQLAESDGERHTTNNHFEHWKLRAEKAEAELAGKERSFLLQRDNYIKLADAIIGEGTFVCEIDPLEAVSQLKAALAEKEAELEAACLAQRLLSQGNEEVFQQQLAEKEAELQRQIKHHREIEGLARQAVAIRDQAITSQQEALVTAMLALEDAKIELTFSHTEDHQKRSALLIPKINSALAQVNACLPVETK